MAEQKNGKEVNEQMKEFREWVKSQPLMKDVDDNLSLRFLHSCYYDVTKAKIAIELFFSLRTSVSDLLLSNRDPLSTQMQKTLKIVNLAQLQISGNRNLWIWQLNDPGLENYDYVQDAKVFFLSTDAWILNNERLEEADIVLMDVKDISVKFLTKFNVSVAKKLSRYQEDAMPIRLKQIHIVNAPPIIDKIFALMKPFIKQEVTDMIHFHSAKSDNLQQFFNKEDLPEDYGGTNGLMSDHMNYVLNDIIMKHRDKLNTNLWWSNEKKSKKDKAKDGSSDTEVTSFRSLDID